VVHSAIRNCSVSDFALYGKQNCTNPKADVTFCDSWIHIWIPYFQMIKFIQPTGKDLKVLIPMVVSILDESGMCREQWTVEKAMVFLHSSNNWENLVACLINNQSAIFAQLRND
jgi:hypothetical protein